MYVIDRIVWAITKEWLRFLAAIVVVAAVCFGVAWSAHALGVVRQSRAAITQCIEYCGPQGGVRAVAQCYCKGTGEVYNVN